MYECVCVRERESMCVCVRARAHVCVCVCVRVCVHNVYINTYIQHIIHTYATNGACYSEFRFS